MIHDECCCGCGGGCGDDDDGGVDSNDGNNGTGDAVRMFIAAVLFAMHSRYTYTHYTTTTICDGRVHND